MVWRWPEEIAILTLVTSAADVFAASPLLLLFVVAAAGYLLGHLELFGAKLGVAAVLFVGLGFGAWDSRLQLPELLQTFGLVLFVYTIGLSCGPGFAAMLRGKGWRQSLLVLTMLCLAALLTLVLERALGLGAASGAGLFAGALTNTPALAAVNELIKGQAAAGLAGATAGGEAAATVAYSLAYPVGVLGVIAVMIFYRRWANNPSEPAPPGKVLNGPLIVQTLKVTAVTATQQPLADLISKHRLDVTLGRCLSRGVTAAVDLAAPLRLGDLITVVGSADELAKTTKIVGELSSVHLEEARGSVDFRRMLLSNPRLAGRRLGDLALQHRYAATVTRLRRGDVEMLPNATTLLEQGDRLRVVATPHDLEAIGRYLGDSEQSISEVDVISLGLGIALGLGLGLLPLPLPGGLKLHLGAAGGPMLVALVLGAHRRTGPILWCLPHGANLTLRQLGLVLFLATVGTRAGRPFAETLSQGAFGWKVFFAGACLSCLTAGVTLWLGHRWLKLPLGLMNGIVGGMHTQPALLAYAQEQTPGDQPSLGYAAVFPLAFIAKVILAQLLLTYG